MGLKACLGCDSPLPWSLGFDSKSQTCNFLSTRSDPADPVTIIAELRTMEDINTQSSFHTTYAPSSWEEAITLGDRKRRIFTIGVGYHPEQQDDVIRLSTWNHREALTTIPRGVWASCKEARKIALALFPDTITIQLRKGLHLDIVLPDWEPPVFNVVRFNSDKDLVRVRWEEDRISAGESSSSALDSFLLRFNSVLLKFDNKTSNVVSTQTYANIISVGASGLGQYTGSDSSVICSHTIRADRALSATMPCTGASGLSRTVDAFEPQHLPVDVAEDRVLGVAGDRILCRVLRPGDDFLEYYYQHKLCCADIVEPELAPKREAGRGERDDLADQGQLKQAKQHLFDEVCSSSTP
ncbi:hypothetical protein B0H66DRAFT_537823 [Apodospora peruviana]|uniref:Uncharacterized protein n=1 Tax=Apodospora peruviana TaxID=516989 RepID=A0AAE0LYW3_9PEZI|nr:hypothetical protein B0H66DRAFT_537823 [Apodospora peruviana]